MQPASDVVLPWSSSVHWPTGAPCTHVSLPKRSARHHGASRPAVHRSSILKRASRANPEQALRVASVRAAAAAEAGTKLASQILQDAKRLSPQQILRQTQQAAQHVFTRTQGEPMACRSTLSVLAVCDWRRFRGLHLIWPRGITVEYLAAGAAREAGAGLNGAADRYMAGHHQPGPPAAPTMPAAPPLPVPQSAPPSELPAIHAARKTLRGTGRTAAEDVEASIPAAYDASGHAEPPPAGPSAVLASDADRVAGTMSHTPAAGRDRIHVELDSAAASANRGSQAAPAGDVTTGGQVPHVSSGPSQAGGGLAPSASSAPSQTVHAAPPLPSPALASVSPPPPLASPALASASPLPPPEVASAPQPALEAQEVTPGTAPGTADSQPEQLPPHTLTTPLAGVNAAARPHDSAEPRAAPIKRKPRERRVPSSPFGRVMGFAGLGASLVAGTVRDSVAGYFGPRPADGEKPASAVSAVAGPLHESLISPVQLRTSVFAVFPFTFCWDAGNVGGQRRTAGECTVQDARSCTEAWTGIARGSCETSYNLHACDLASCCSRPYSHAHTLHMQMISIQDDNVLPPAFQKALDRVRAGGWQQPDHPLLLRTPAASCSSQRVC